MTDIAKRNKIDGAFKKAVTRGNHAVSGQTPGGFAAPPIIEVLRDLVFEVTGDQRYKGAR